MKLSGQKVQMGGHLCYYNRIFRTFVLNILPTIKIGKNWITSGFFPRNDEKHFQPIVLKKGTKFQERTTRLITTYK